MALITLILDNTIIERRFFTDSHLQIEGYLNGLKLDMLEHNDEALKTSSTQPEFRVDIAPKKITRH